MWSGKGSTLLTATVPDVFHTFKMTISAPVHQNKQDLLEMAIQRIQSQ